jgi:hypothetical protein
MACLKRFLVPVFLFLLLFFIFALGWFTNKILANSAAILLDTTRQVEMLLKEDQWFDAEISFQQTEKKWARISKYWPLLIHHQEMDRIEECISKIKSYLQHQDRSNALAELYLLMNYIQHIPQNKALNLQNIF